ncbi:MAG: hypothetical protein JRI72_00140 [Deltaproteobacteria bacterium]|nr:hypothetical protein [Deltaproteobacteria bacterium]
MELIISTISICLSVFNLLVVTGVIIVKKPAKDKYKEFRDPVTGLLGRKRK